MMARSSNATVIDIEDAQRIRRERRAEAVKSRRVKAHKERTQVERSRKSFIAGRRLLYLILVILMVVIAVIAMSHISALKSEHADAAAVLKDKTDQQTRLESELSVITTPEYIEEQARERLRMIKKGEILYVFDDSKEDNTQ
jgi:cell division protein FtsB